MAENPFFTALARSAGMKINWNPPPQRATRMIINPQTQEMLFLKVALMGIGLSILPSTQASEFVASPLVRVSGPIYEFPKYHKAMTSEPPCYTRPEPHRGAEAEISSAVNPLDSKNIIAVMHYDQSGRGGAVLGAAAVTHDGGETWKRSIFPGINNCTYQIFPSNSKSKEDDKNWQGASDPYVVFGRKGTAYAVVQSVPPLGIGPSNDQERRRLNFYASTDKGRSWKQIRSDNFDDRSIAKSGYVFRRDRPTLSVGDGKVGAESVYITWQTRRLIGGKMGTVFSRSYTDDRGEMKFTDPVITYESVEGSFPLSSGIEVLKNGDSLLLLQAIIDFDARSLAMGARIPSSVPGIGGSTLGRTDLPISYTVKYVTCEPRWLDVSDELSTCDRGIGWIQHAPLAVSPANATFAFDPGDESKFMPFGPFPVTANNGAGRVTLAWQENTRELIGDSPQIRGSINTAHFNINDLNWSTPTKSYEVEGSFVNDVAIALNNSGVLGMLWYEFGDVTETKVKFTPLPEPGTVRPTPIVVAGPFNLRDAVHQGPAYMLGDYFGLSGLDIDSFGAVIGIPNAANRVETHGKQDIYFSRIRPK